MTVDPNKPILVDTNCLIRVYFSPLRPVFSRPAAGYELKTLQELANELQNIAKRRDEFAWLDTKTIQDDVQSSVLALTAAQQQTIYDEAVDIQKDGNSFLRAYCDSKNIDVRKLSLPDAKVLAAALELKVALATDEWPLRYVVSVYKTHDDGTPIEMFSSVELIALLEEEGLLNKEERKQTYADWLKFGEKLLRESPQIYRTLFSEEPPSGQH